MRMGKGRLINAIVLLLLAAIGLNVTRRRDVPIAADGPTLASGAAPAATPAGPYAVARRVIERFIDHRLMQEAAGVTFYMLLAIFPAIAALVSLYGLFADPKSVSDLLDSMSSLVPGGGIDLIRQQIMRVTGNGAGNLSLGLIVGLLVSLWFSNQGTKAMVDVLNVVYDQRERRSYVRLTLITLLMTFCTILFVLVAMAAVVIIPIILQFVGLGPELGLIIWLLRWPVLLALVSLFLAVIYHFGPCREREPWHLVSWGSSFAAIGWLAVSFGFSFYVGHFSNYNATYGSLGAVVGFMTWIWISVMVVLLGAELSAELHRIPPPK